MAKKKMYGRAFLDINVVEAARQRMHAAYDQFDSIVVSFSGGKDSIAVLGIVKDVAEERGELPIDVVLYDEELIADSILETLRWYQAQDWVRFHWVCVQESKQAMLLGKVTQVIAWDPAREWVRPMPPEAITELPGLDVTQPIDQKEMNAYIAPLFKGRVGIVLGLRAEEARSRVLSLSAKLHENWISEIASSRRTKAANTARILKPIYDWRPMDVFKYIEDTGLPLPDYYINRLRTAAYGSAGLGGLKLMRWSTPLHGSNSDHFWMWRSTEPVFYQQLVDIFPELVVHERYGLSFDWDATMDEYGQDFKGVRRYIDTHYQGDPKAHEGALQFLRYVAKLARTKPDVYTPRVILTHYINGSYKRGIQGDFAAKTSVAKEQVKANRAKLKAREAIAIQALRDRDDRPTAD